MNSVAADKSGPLHIADARGGKRHVFIRDYMVNFLVGVHAHEKLEAQRVRINLDLSVDEGNHPIIDDIRNVVNYEDMANGIQNIAESGHVNLVETLAEKIAAMCLEDHRVHSARVRVEKLDILENAASVGVEIERFSEV